MVDDLIHNPDHDFFQQVADIKPAEQEVGMDTPKVNGNDIWAQINNGQQHTAGLSPEQKVQFDPNDPNNMNNQHNVSLDQINQAGPMLSVTAYQMGQEAGMNTPEDGVGYLSAQMGEAVNDLLGAITKSDPEPEPALAQPQMQMQPAPTAFG